MQTRRRSFLKLGLAGAVTLAAAGAVYRCSAPRQAAQRFVLDANAQALLGALIPAMLGPMLPAASDAAARAAAIVATTTAVGAAIAGLPLASQKEVQDLFALLSLAPARRWLAGVRGGWAQANPAEVDAFLRDWRGHRLQTLQTAYHALHDLILGAWYADPASWNAIGYPGPLKELA